ncbi:PGBD5 [Cordylochernes scorpioides]|uniref:PGBD5 n=1 Tax=Cordylochernes scorpioides TaxID=51811 RepID=A0ABY6KKY9_9ARAC|nr:PGBD5 [Cordylochernes scorpioides]
MELYEPSTSRGSSTLSDEFREVNEYVYDSGSEMDDEDESDDDDDEHLDSEPEKDRSKRARGKRKKGVNWEGKDGRPPLPPFNGCPGINIPSPSTPFDAFKIFFTEEILAKITQETNHYAKNIIAREKKKDAIKPHSNMAKWSDVTLAQMKLFFCVIIHMSLVQKPALKDYWSGCRLMKTTFCQSIQMSRSCFFRILSMLHLCDNSKYIGRGKPGHDKLFKIRPVLDPLLSSFGETYTPQKNLTIDEAMYLFRGQVTFGASVREKPHKNEMKIFQLRESESGYVYNLEIITSMDPHRTSTTDYALKIVDSLAGKFYDQGYVIYFNNQWFSSPEVFDRLWKNKTLAVGLVRPSRKILPKLFYAKKLNRGEMIMRRRKHLLLLKWKESRNFVLLSTLHEGKLLRSRGDQRKPDVFVDYNKWKGGVSRSDQIMAYYSFTRKTLKWWKKLFFHLFGLCFVNGNLIYNKANPASRMNLKEFYMAVGESLLKEAIEGLVDARVDSGDKVEIERLLGRHFPQKIIIKEGSVVWRNCKVCLDCSRHQTGKAARKETHFECKQCSVSLCIGDCFEKYHTQSEYWLSDRSMHPDHNTGQLRCLIRMDVLFWIDVCYIEGCKDGRAYMVRRMSNSCRGRRKRSGRRTKLRGGLQANCCLKRLDCCLPPTPVYLLEDSRRFYELLSPVLLLFSFIVLQLLMSTCDRSLEAQVVSANPWQLKLPRKEPMSPSLPGIRMGTNFQYVFFQQNNNSTEATYKVAYIL